MKFLSTRFLVNYLGSEHMNDYYLRAIDPRLIETDEGYLSGKWVIGFQWVIYGECFIPHHLTGTKIDIWLQENAKDEWFIDDAISAAVLDLEEDALMLFLAFK